MNRIVMVTIVVFGWVSGVQALQMDWVTVLDRDNAPDTRYDATGYGGVSYVYNIGKYEVTNSQYAEFLNAVAASDPNDLYSSEMGGGWNDIGGITQNGLPDSYTYSVRPDRGDRPVSRRHASAA